MKYTALLVFICLCLNGSQAFAQVSANELYRQCMKAEAFLSKPEGVANIDVVRCLSHVDGFKDGVAISEVFYNEDRKENLSGVCFPNGINTIQLVSVVNKWFKDNPESQHKPASLEMWFAFIYHFPCQ